MITENGTIKTQTEMNEEVQKEFTKGNFILGIAFIVIGAIGVALFTVLYVLSDMLEFDGAYFPFLILSGGVLGGGIGLLVVVNKAVKTAGSTKRVYTYEFFKDYFSVTENFNGENVAAAKFYNAQVLKAKETKKYLFFFTNPSSACPVSKSGLSEAELNTLRAIFKLPVKGSAVELSAEVLPRPDESQANENGADGGAEDPFDDFKN